MVTRTRESGEMRRKSLHDGRETRLGLVDELVPNVAWMGAINPHGRFNLAENERRLRRIRSTILWESAPLYPFALVLFLSSKFALLSSRLCMQPTSWSWGTTFPCRFHLFPLFHYPLVATCQILSYVSCIHTYVWVNLSPFPRFEYRVY